MFTQSQVLQRPAQAEEGHAKGILTQPPVQFCRGQLKLKKDMLQVYSPILQFCRGQLKLKKDMLQV
jgi:hypothetical protein